MSEQILKFKVGNRVKTMQTDDLVKTNRANMEGEVVDIWKSGLFFGDAVIVNLDSEDFFYPQVFWACQLNHRQVARN